MPPPWGALHGTTARAAPNTALPAPKFTAPQSAWAHGALESCPKGRLTLGAGRELSGPGTSEYPSKEPLTTFQCMTGN